MEQTTIKNQSRTLSSERLRKIKLWAANPQVVDLPQVDPARLPYFGHKSFDTPEEYFAWKSAYRLEIARQGGVRWKK